MKKRILVVAFYIPGTGFSRVMDHIIDGIKFDFEIHYFGIGYEGAIQKRSNITIYPFMKNREDREGLEQLRNLGNLIQPDIIFLLHDLRYQTMYISALYERIGKSKFISYTPLDGKIVQKKSLEPLQYLDKCVLYTQFGKTEFQKILCGERPKNNTNTSFEVLPHGVDTTTFFPLESHDKTELKKKVFGNSFELKNSFVVLNANRVDARKRIDITIEGFSLFAQNKPDNVKLYLHHPAIDAGKYTSLMKIIRENGIEDRLILNRDENGVTRPVSDEQLNLIFNACDVGINTAMGEGWGLVSLEHAACGIPQIVPNNSACSEIWEGAADFLDPVYSRVPWFSEFEMSAVSPQDLAEKLEQLYQDRLYWEKMAKAAFNRAHEARFQWSNISKQWASVFRKLAQEKKVSTPVLA